MIKLAAFVSMVLLAGIPGTAFSIDTTELNLLLNPFEQKAVLDGKILTTVYLKNHPPFSNHLQIDSIEGLTLPYSKTTDYSENEMLAVEKAFIPFEPGSGNLLALFNRLTAYTRLAGIKYYSRTDKKLQPYILSSYRIKSPKNPVAVDDETYDFIPAEYSAYFMIEDNRFGKLLMQTNVTTQDFNITIRSKTLEPMSRLLISINDKGEYEQQLIFLYDSHAGGYYYYSMQAMRIRSGFLLSLGQLTPSNFANRIRALTVHFASLFGHDWKDRLIAAP